MRFNHLVILRPDTRDRAYIVRDANYEQIVHYRLVLNHQRAFRSDLHCWLYDFPRINLADMGDQCRERAALYYGFIL